MDYSYSRYKLANGLTVVEVHQPHLHRGSVAIYFKNGSRYETQPDNGLSHFLEHMIFRGTEGYPTAYDLNLAVEQLGGTLFAATGPDSTEFEMSLPMESLPSGAALLAKVVTKPVFGNIQIERKVIAEEIQEELDEDGRPIDIDFLSRQRLWPGHPLGQSVTGPLSNALGFDDGDVERHFNAHYLARNAIVCLTGAFDKHLREVVERDFSSIPDRKVVLHDIPLEYGAGPSTHHAHRPGSQTQIRIAFRGLGGDDPDRIPAAIMMGILDDGMSTRLHRRIFDELGLAYNVSADLEIYEDTGAFNVDATSSHRNVVEIIDQVGLLLKQFCDRAVSDDELQKAISRMVWGIEDFQDDPHAMSSWYGEQELYFRPQSLESRIDSVVAVTQDDVSRVANRIFTPSNLHITTVGVLDKGTREEVKRATRRLCTR